MQSLTGSLVVTIADAKDLNSDQFGKVDPYCKASFPGLVFRHRYRTKAHKRGGNTPIWDETHTFHLNGTRGDARLKLSLYDQAVFRSKPIGRASLYLAELLEHRGEKAYYPLIEMDRPDFRVAGYIGLIVDFLDERKGSRLSPERRQSNVENTQSSISPQMQSQQMQSQQMQPQVTEPQLAHPQSSMDTHMQSQNFADNQHPGVDPLKQQDFHQQQQQQQQEFQHYPQYQQFQQPIQSDLEADKSSQFQPMTQLQQQQQQQQPQSEIVQH